MAERGDGSEFDVLAGEYVLGTLTGPPRAAFEQHLATDASLRARVRYWEDRFGPLGGAVPPLTPPATLWPAIERALDADRLRALAPMAWWNSLALWRTLAAAGVAVAIAVVAIGALLLGPLGNRGPATPAAIAVLADETRQAVWLAETDAAGTRLALRAVKAVAPPAGRAFELWVIPGPGEIPRSLGLLSSSGTTLETVPLPLRPGAVLAVSVEPPDGSPTGRATGPVVQLGTLIAP